MGLGLSRHSTVLRVTYASGIRLRRIMPKVESRLFYLGYVEGRGIDLFRVAYEREREGVGGEVGGQVGTSRTQARPVGEKSRTLATRR